MICSIQNDTPNPSASLPRDLYRLTEKVRSRPDIVMMLTLLLLSFLLHASTAARTVTFSDSGDFPMAISAVGNCHGPGYPLFLMTAKMFSLLVPFGSLAFRVSLYSGIMSSMTTCLIYWIVYRMSLSRTQRLCQLQSQRRHRPCTSGANIFLAVRIWKRRQRI